MTPFELRPLAIGELLDRVFTLYRRHLSTFVGIMAVPAIFSFALALATTTAQHLREPLIPRNIAFDSPETIRVLVGVAAGYVIVIAAYWVAYMLALGATAMAVSEIYAGHDIGVGAAFARARQQTGRLMLLALLWSVLIMGTGLALLALSVGVALLLRATPIIIVPITLLAVIGMFAIWIFLFLRYAISAPALVLEGASALAALRRSAFLTRGFLGRVFLLSFCAAMLTYTAIMLFQTPFNVAAVLAGKETTAGFSLDIIAAVSSAIGQTLTAPFMIVGLVVLYYDLRIRKEALDLQMMMSALDSQDGGLPVATPPPPALPS